MIWRIILFVASCVLIAMCGYNLASTFHKSNSITDAYGYTDSEGEWHNSTAQQAKIAAFIREHHCEAMEHDNRGGRLDEKTLVVHHPVGYTVYRCPGIDSRIYIDDNEVQP